MPGSYFISVETYGLDTVYEIYLVVAPFWPHLWPRCITTRGEPSEGLVLELDSSGISTALDISTCPLPG